MKKVFSLLMLMLSFVVLFAQEKSVTGSVTDENSESLPGVNVIVKGTTLGTITDVDGSFKISVPKGRSILQFSFIGFDNKEIDISNTNKVTIQLKSSTIGLDEVVAVGYGVQKKVNLSGSIESVKGDALAKRSTIQTSQALQGIAAGVTVTSNNGKPGKEGTTVRIRGIGTINDNSPLVLVDGVSSSLDAVDPNDIESMSILKDAASAAIYGSRAANGVILITTKRGKTEKVTVTYKGSVGITTPITMPKNASAWDYMTLYDEANANDLRNDAGVPGGSIYGTDKINAWKNATDRDAYPNTDMLRETYKKQVAETQQYIGFSVGSEKFSSNTSLNYTWQDSHIPNSYYKRYGIRSNNSYNVNKFVQFGFDLSARNSYSEDAANSGLDQLMRQPAIYQTRYSNGVWGSNYSGTPHQMQIITDKLNMHYEDWYETLAKISATIKPFAGMRLDFSYAPKFSGGSYKDVGKQAQLYDYKTLQLIYTSPSPATITEVRDKTREDDINILANYTQSFGKHDVAVLGGFQYLTNTYNYLSAYRQGNNFPQLEEINAFDPTGLTNGGYTSEWALMSYFGRLNYAYDGKYLLEANVRYDGSSRFANGYKWGLFPSFSGAWRFSSENFMQGLSWLNNGKLRASWGELGNQSSFDGNGKPINYPFALTVATNQYAVFGTTLNTGFAPVNYALADITWESTRMIDFGIDLSFFKGKLDATFDWYKKDTRDILLNMAIPGVLGYANSPKQNAGAVENKGWDLTLSHSNTIGKFYYKVTGILSDVKNQITDLGGLAPQVSGVHVKQVGSPIDAFYGYQADGLFGSFTEARSYAITQFGKLQGGDIRYKDLDDDKKITGTDRVVLGNPIPRYAYSMDIYTSYKGFDLALFFQGIAKRDSYISGWLAYPFQNASTALVQHLDRWSETNPNPDAAYPRLSINQQTNNLQTSSFWMVNAAYFRLKNVQLGYTLPAHLLKDKGISSVRFYANGTNVFTQSKMPLGMDPESPESVQGSYPLISTYTFGVEVKF
jgi:TonB-linked SusC/RagA family outer membrane protein